MTKRNGKNSKSNEPKILRPALTPEAREKQLVSYAVDLAEKQLLEGTASSQVLTHYLKLATERERLERVLLEKEVELKKAKTEAIQSAHRTEELFRDAVNAFKRYNGDRKEEDSDEY